jgi:hypothetical protein
MAQMVIKNSYADDFAEALRKAIKSNWQVKFMVANEYAYIAVLEM